MGGGKGRGSSWVGNWRVTDLLTGAEADCYVHDDKLNWGKLLSKLRTCTYYR